MGHDLTPEHEAIRKEIEASWSESDRYQRVHNLSPSLLRYFKDQVIQAKARGDSIEQLQENDSKCVSSGQ